MTPTIEQFAQAGVAVAALFALVLLVLSGLAIGKAFLALIDKVMDKLVDPLVKSSAATQSLVAGLAENTKQMTEAIKLSVLNDQQQSELLANLKVCAAGHSEVIEDVRKAQLEQARKLDDIIHMLGKPAPAPAPVAPVVSIPSAPGN